MWSAECGMDARATERSATINSALRIPHSALSAQPSNMVGCSALRGGVKPKCLRSEEHTSELQSHSDLVCRLLLEKKKKLRTRRLDGCDVFCRSRDRGQ